MSSILFADPAGNLTAIVRHAALEERLALAKSVLEAGIAEQVGFEVPPVCGGCGRLEMMGGEFCGNAVRSFGFLKAAERWTGGRHTMEVEISGAAQPVSVTVDLGSGTAFARMPLPLGLEECEVAGAAYPLVRMEGIIHLIAEDTAPSEAFVEQALAAVARLSPEAFGVMFLQEDSLTPAVWVRETQSLVWEGSCGSGSLACGWYRTQKRLPMPDGEVRCAFLQRGGVIETAFCVENGKIAVCCMGGPVSISGWETI